MLCPRCQAENRQGRRFCAECGASLATACRSCGFPNEPGEKFCGGCAAPLTVASRPPAPKFTSPEAYTPKHLAERILNSKSTLEGERKQVTVLFADLKGSMELLADRDPEEARKLLDPVLERMMDAVHRFEGTVNQVMGDGIMALFGAPLAHEDHAVRACYAALDMQAAIRGYAEEVRRAHGVEVQIRVGLNSGEVVVRAIGNDLHMDYSAIGQTSHLAARMEQFALPGTIRLTADTLRLAEGFVQVTPLGPVPVKGLAGPMEVFELWGAWPARTRWQATAVRGLTRFVGRRPELDALGRALERAGAGHGQVVAVVGEPGVGKSRLAWQFAHSPVTQGWLVLESGSVSYGKATSYLPVTDLLRTYFHIEDRDDQRRIREKVTGRLLTLDRALEPTLLPLLALLDVPVDDPHWPALDPTQRRQRTLDAVKRLLLRESQVQPLLAIFEDLHWIDSESQALLDALVESLPTARLLLLVNYRPEYQHQWGSKSYYSQLRLDPLPAATADELLQALLGSDPALQPLKQLLVERTDGNPFFLEESVRTLVETQALVGGRGAYRLAREVSGIQVPATVQTVLAARIDRLPAEAKWLLQSAAVIGKDLPYGLLRALTESTDAALRQQLAHLQAAELLYEARQFPDLEYTFKHALTHEVAYGSLLQERRRALHVRLVEAIEALHPDRLAEHVDRLAHHAFRGELWDKAVAYLRQAGARSAGRSAYREAVERFEQALVALAHLPESRQGLELAVDLRFELRNALFPLGEVARDLNNLHTADRLAESLGDRRRSGWAAAFMARDFSLLGDQDRAVASGTRALHLSADLGDVELGVLANAYLGSIHHALGDYGRAVELFGSSIAALRGERAGHHLGLPGPASVFFRSWLVWSLAKLGRFPDGLATGEDAIRLADAADQPLVRAVARYSLGFLYLHQEQFERAIPLLERSLDLCHAWNLVAWFPNVASSLGYAYARSGRTAEGVLLLEQAVGQASSLKVIVNHAAEVAWLGEAYLLAGRPADAASLAQRALALARQHKEHGNEAQALRLQGEIAALGTPPAVAEAEQRYGEALAVTDRLGMQPLRAHCHRGLERLFRHAGLGAKSETHRAAARRLARELDLGHRVEESEAEEAS